MGLLGVTLPAIYTAAVAGAVHAGAGSEWTAQRRELLQTAGCDFLITTSTASESVILGAEAAAEATAVVCGSGSAADRIEVVAETSARAAATAVANVAGSCYANGNGSFKVNGLTIAQTEATAYAEAFAESTVSAAACGRCTAAAHFVAESWSRIFFDAVAEAEFRLQGAANGGSVTSATAAFVEAVAEATVVAFASVLATASASADDGCNVRLVSSTETGDVDDPDATFCDINVAGEANTVAQNAVVSAVFEAEAFACEGRAESSGRVAAQELAIATAEAISSVVADCSVIGNGFACALGEADVNTMAQATADAFARGFVNAVSECDPPRCTINVEIITENTASVLVKAASEAYDAACAGAHLPLSHRLSPAVSLTTLLSRLQDETRVSTNCVSHKTIAYQDLAN
eukprot:jgi/Ulvmu1/6329/UM029_0037.1